MFLQSIIQSARKCTNEVDRFYQNDVESLYLIGKGIQCFNIRGVLEAFSTIKILIEDKRNEEILYLYTGGKYALSQDYKILVCSNMASLVCRKGGTKHKGLLRSSTCSRTNICKSNEWWMKAWSSAKNATAKWTKWYFCFYYLSTNKIRNFRSTWGKSCLLSFMLVRESSETAAINLHSLLTFTLAAFQVSSHQCISFRSSHQGWETIFKIYLKSELTKKINRYCGNCHSELSVSLVLSYWGCIEIALGLIDIKNLALCL